VTGSDDVAGDFLGEEPYTRSAKPKPCPNPSPAQTQALPKPKPCEEVR